MTSVPKFLIEHHKAEGGIDYRASTLLTLHSQSMQQGHVVPLLDGQDGVAGSREYYEKLASEITAYALEDPARCQNFLMEMFLPQSERMNLQRKRALAKL